MRQRLTSYCVIPEVAGEEDLLLRQLAILVSTSVPLRLRTRRLWALRSSLFGLPILLPAFR